MAFENEEFNEFILKNGVIGFFEEPIQLKSGRLSSWYVNWRNVAEDVFLLDQLTDYVLSFTKDQGLKPDCFFGVPEGATKVGILTQYKWAKEDPSYAPHSHVIPMGRGKPKTHGAPKDKYFVGKPQGDTIIIEDVTTTGGSLLQTIDQLVESQVPLIAAFGLTNRMEVTDEGYSVKEAVESKGVPYYSMSNAFDLLPKAYKDLQPGEHILQSLKEEFSEYGIAPLPNS
ncbi:MAG: hypothetical protein ACLFP2_04360 [Candidatus Woesearchaeota archaeon]